MSKKNSNKKKSPTKRTHNAKKKKTKKYEEKLPRK